MQIRTQEPCHPCWITPSGHGDYMAIQLGKPVWSALVIPALCKEPLSGLAPIQQSLLAVL